MLSMLTREHRESPSSAETYKQPGARTDLLPENQLLAWRRVRSAAPRTLRAGICSAATDLVRSARKNYIRICRVAPLSASASTRDHRWRIFDCAASRHENRSTTEHSHTHSNTRRLDPHTQQCFAISDLVNGDQCQARQEASQQILAKEFKCYTSNGVNESKAGPASLPTWPPCLCGLKLSTPLPTCSDT